MVYYNAYTDGSFGNDGLVHGGVVFGDENQNVLSTLHVTTSVPDFVSMHNIGGEILAAWSAIFSVVSSVRQKNEEVGLECYKMNLVYDLQGVGSWLNGWKTNTKATKWYKNSIQEMLRTVPNLELNTIWVKGHGYTVLNNVADVVASYKMTCTRYGSSVCDMDEVLRSDYGF